MTNIRYGLGRFGGNLHDGLATCLLFPRAVNERNDIDHSVDVCHELRPPQYLVFISD